MLYTLVRLTSVADIQPEEKTSYEPNKGKVDLLRLFYFIFLASGCSLGENNVRQDMLQKFKCTKD